MKIWFPISDVKTGTEAFTVQLNDSLQKNGFETVITRYPKTIEAMPWLLSTLKPPAKTNIIHLNAGSAAGFFRHGIPTVITGHGAFERPDYDAHKSLSQRYYHSFLVRPGVKKAVARATATTVVSRWVAKVYEQDYSAKHVEVIHNWVAPNQFSPTKKPLARRLLFVGRPAWQKGSFLLPALVALLGREFEWTCTLSDHDWPGEINENVRLIGPVAKEEMPELYRSHDALIVPSLAEGFCLAAAEAMACGLPVFGFRGHGLDDVLGPLAESCSAQMQDVSALVKCIKTVFEQRQVYTEMAEQCYQRVQENFTEKIALAKYISLYEKITS